MIINKLFCSVGEESGIKYFKIEENHSELALNKWNQDFDSDKYHIKKISNEKINFNDGFNKIKFISDDSLRLDKLIYFPTLRNLLFKIISYEITGYNNKKEGVKCMICNHYYFKDNFNYHPYVCNKCHDFSMTVMNLSDFFYLKY